MASTTPPVRPAALRVPDEPVELGDHAELAVIDTAGEIMNLAFPGAPRIVASPAGAAIVTPHVSGATLSVSTGNPSGLRSQLTVILYDGATAIDTKTIDLVIPWTARGPRTVDTLPGYDQTLPWTGNLKAQRARLILHDLLLQLPDAFTVTLDLVPVILVKSDPHPAFYQGGIGNGEFILITEGAVDVLDENSDTITPADRSFAVLMAHEMAHGWAARKSGGFVNGTARDLLAVATLGAAQYEAGALAFTAGAGVVSLFFPPAAALVLCGVGLVTGCALVQGALFGMNALSAHDETSEWCKASGWRQRNTTGLSIPFFGPLFFAASDDYPNAGTALAAQIDMPFDVYKWRTHVPITLNAALLDLHNVAFDFAKVHETANKDEQYAANLDAVAPLIAGAGLATTYAALSPMEDFAESFAVLALRLTKPLPAIGTIEIKEQGTTDALFQANTRKPDSSGYHIPNDERVAYFRSRDLLPAADVVIGGSEPLRTVVTLKGWRVLAALPDVGALDSATEAVKAQQAFTRARTAWDKGPASYLARADRAVRALAQPPHDPARRFSFWTALECHGDGLHPVDGHGSGTEPGDVITGRDRKVYVAASAGPSGIGALIGGPDAEGNLGGTVDLKALDLCFRWSPDETPRRFCEPGRHGAAYRDIEANLRTMLGWWGDADRGTQAFDSVAAFSDALAVVLGLPPSPDAACVRGPTRAPIARLHTLGDGLRPYEPGEPVQVGDIVVCSDGNALSVVTRIDAAGRPVDLLTGGTTREGGLSEEAGAVRLEHRIDPRDIHLFWRPNSSPRTFPMPTDTPNAETGLTNIDYALRHVLAHDGAKVLLRQEEEIYLLEPLGILAGLLVEGEPSPARRRALGATVRDTDRVVLDRMVAFGAPCGRSRSAAPGDILLLADGDVAIAAAVEGSEIRQIMRARGTDELVLDHVALAPEAVPITWRPSVTPRAVSDAPAGLADFYGGDGLAALFALPGTHGEAVSTELSFQGETATYMPSDGYGLAGLASAKAPDWVRQRLWDASDLDDVQERCDTLGAGMRMDSTGPLPVGTWLFGSDGIAIVMVVDAAGRPALVYRGGSSGTPARLATHDGRHDGKVWVPDASARTFVSPSRSPGYDDRNRLIGMLRIWGAHRANLTTPLFADRDLQASNAFTAAAAKVLRRGPETSEEWLDYLAEHGAIKPGPGRPGDLCVFKDPEWQGVLLDDNTVLIAKGDSGRVSLGKSGRITAYWVPDL